MGHPHGHSHDPSGHAHGSGNLRRLSWTLGLVVLYMVAEVIGGLWTHSLALLADAGHMLSDAGALGLSIFAIRLARRPPNPKRSFGYYRAEILAALANGATLVAIAFFILAEAWERLREPHEVLGGPMMAVAAGGLVINLAGLGILHGGKSESLNVRSAWIHVLSDALGSVQAMAAGALIWLFGWTWADPVASALIALLVTWSAWTLLRESVGVLMESAPPRLDSGEVQAAINSVEGVQQVHDLHIWTITSGFDSLSAHVVAPRPRPGLLAEIRAVVAARFGIGHVTLQVESRCCEDDCGPEDPHGPCTGLPC